MRLPNKTSPRISQQAGWSVWSTESHCLLQRPAHSCRSPLSRSSRAARSGTSAPPLECDKMADRGGSRMTVVEPVALEEWPTQLWLHLWCRTPGLLISFLSLVPMGTTDSRQCGTETEQQHHVRSSLCLPVSSWSLSLFSLSTCLKIKSFVRNQELDLKKSRPKLYITLTSQIFISDSIGDLKSLN